MTNFICKKCGYRFEKEKTLVSCPYCGERGGVTKEQTAGELLENLDEE